MKVKVIIYHSILGIRQGERDMATLIESQGFEVSVPDLYDGEVFDSYGEAMSFFDELGIEALINRAQKQLETTSGPVIFAGFSNGGVFAELMALNYPETLSCLLFHAAIPVSILGAPTWPSSVPIQIHYAEQDPWWEEGELQQFLQEVSQSGSQVQLLEYPVEEHLFTDQSLIDEYNKQSTKQLFDEVKDFLDQFR